MKFAAAMAILSRPSWSRCQLLSEAIRRHIVLEKGRVGESWRSQRWDSFAFNTPNALTVNARMQI
jgi:cation diffusion facilitator CzcD-associated flavoprotein CzcO